MTDRDQDEGDFEATEEGEFGIGDDSTRLSKMKEGSSQKEGEEEEKKKRKTRRQQRQQQQQQQQNSKLKSKVEGSSNEQEKENQENHSGKRKQGTNRSSNSNNSNNNNNNNSSKRNGKKEAIKIVHDAEGKKTASKAADLSSKMITKKRTQAVKELKRLLSDSRSSPSSPLSDDAATETRVTRGKERLDAATLEQLHVNMKVLVLDIPSEIKATLPSLGILNNGTKRVNTVNEKEIVGEEGGEDAKTEAGGAHARDSEQFKFLCEQTDTLRNLSVANYMKSISRKIFDMKELLKPNSLAVLPVGNGSAISSNQNINVSLDSSPFHTHFSLMESHFEAILSILTQSSPNSQAQLQATYAFYLSQLLYGSLFAARMLFKVWLEKGQGPQSQQATTQDERAKLTTATTRTTEEPLSQSVLASYRELALQHFDLAEKICFLCSNAAPATAVSVWEGRNANRLSNIVLAIAEIVPRGNDVDFFYRGAILMYRIGRLVNAGLKRGLPDQVKKIPRKVLMSLLTNATDTASSVSEFENVWKLVQRNKVMPVMGNVVSKMCEPENVDVISLSVTNIALEVCSAPGMNHNDSSQYAHALSGTESIELQSAELDTKLFLEPQRITGLAIRDRLFSANYDDVATAYIQSTHKNALRLTISLSVDSKVNELLGCAYNLESINEAATKSGKDLGEGKIPGPEDIQFVFSIGNDNGNGNGKRTTNGGKETLDIEAIQNRLGAYDHSEHVRSSITSCPIRLTAPNQNPNPNQNQNQNQHENENENENGNGNGNLHHSQKHSSPEELPRRDPGSTASKRERNTSHVSHDSKEADNHLSPPSHENVQNESSKDGMLLGDVTQSAVQPTVPWRSTLNEDNPERSTQVYSLMRSMTGSHGNSNHAGSSPGFTPQGVRDSLKSSASSEEKGLTRQQNLQNWTPSPTKEFDDVSEAGNTCDRDSGAKAHDESSSFSAKADTDYSFAEEEEEGIDDDDDDNISFTDAVTEENQDKQENRHEECAAKDSGNSNNTVFLEKQETSKEASKNSHTRTVSKDSAEWTQSTTLVADENDPGEDFGFGTDEDDQNGAASNGAAPNSGGDDYDGEAGKMANSYDDFQTRSKEEKNVDSRRRRGVNEKNNDGSVASEPFDKSSETRSSPMKKRASHQGSQCDEAVSMRRIATKPLPIQNTGKTPASDNASIAATKSSRKSSSKSTQPVTNETDHGNARDFPTKREESPNENGSGLSGSEELNPPKRVRLTGQVNSLQDKAGAQSGHDTRQQIRSPFSIGDMQSGSTGVGDVKKDEIGPGYEPSMDHDDIFTPDDTCTQLDSQASLNVGLHHNASSKSKWFNGKHAWSSNEHQGANNPSSRQIKDTRQPHENSSSSSSYSQNGQSQGNRFAEMELSQSQAEERIEGGAELEKLLQSLLKTSSCFVHQDYGRTHADEDSMTPPLEATPSSTGQDETMYDTVSISRRRQTSSSSATHPTERKLGKLNSSYHPLSLSGYSGNDNNRSNGTNAYSSSPAHEETMFEISRNVRSSYRSLCEAVELLNGTIAKTRHNQAQKQVAQIKKITDEFDKELKQAQDVHEENQRQLRKMYVIVDALYKRDEKMKEEEARRCEEQERKMDEMKKKVEDLRAKVKEALEEEKQFTEAGVAEVDRMRKEYNKSLKKQREASRQKLQNLENLLQASMSM